MENLILNSYVGVKFSQYFGDLGINLPISIITEVIESRIQVVLAEMMIERLLNGLLLLKCLPLFDLLAHHNPLISIVFALLVQPFERDYNLFFCLVQNASQVVLLVLVPYNGTEEANQQRAND
jgi:hypothetical protein